MSEDKIKKRDYAEFARKLRISRTPTNDNAYVRRHGRFSSAVQYDFTMEEIDRIIKEGDPEQIRILSRFYFRTSGIYAQTLRYFATLLDYSTVIIPIFDTNKNVSKDSFNKRFTKACEFIDKINVPINFSRITLEILLNGVYYGIFRDDSLNGGYTIQDLPVAFCRTCFKDTNNLDIIEFDLNYFNRIINKKDKAAAIENYPRKIKLAYDKFLRGELKDSWVEITPSEGALCFYYYEPIPLFISSIPSILKLEEAQSREAKRDENELYKILVQKLPVDKNGELVFELEEAVELHKSLSSMLSKDETIDVLTTFADVKLENVQDSAAATQSADRLEKYKNATYDNLGISSILFNSDGSSSLVESINKDIALMSSWAQMYSTWLELQLNLRFGKPTVSFALNILPITFFNRKDMQNQYLNGAKYGYSKMYAGVALGIKQSHLISLITFENDYLNLPERMIPLQSSYTTSGTEIATKNKKTEEIPPDTIEDENINNDGGRPSLDEEEKSEKTQQNIKSAEG